MMGLELSRNGELCIKENPKRSTMIPLRMWFFLGFSTIFGAFIARSNLYGLFLAKGDEPRRIDNKTPSAHSTTNDDDNVTKNDDDIVSSNGVLRSAERVQTRKSQEEYSAKNATTTSGTASYGEEDDTDLDSYKVEPLWNCTPGGVAARRKKFIFLHIFKTAGMCEWYCAGSLANDHHFSKTSFLFSVILSLVEWAVLDDVPVESLLKSRCLLRLFSFAFAVHRIVIPKYVPSLRETV